MSTITTPSFTHLLCGLIPDPSVGADALSTIPKLKSPQAQFESLLQVVSAFAVRGDGRCPPDPEGTTAHGAALLTLGQAASGLYALLSASASDQAWTALGPARTWALTKANQIGGLIPEEARTLFGDARLLGPDAVAAILPVIEASVGPTMAGMFAAWDVVGYLLHIVPSLRENEAAYLIDTVLLGLSRPTSAIGLHQG